MTQRDEMESLDITSILLTGDLGLTRGSDQPGVFDEGLLSELESADLLCINLEFPFTTPETRMAPYTHPSLQSLTEYSTVLTRLNPDVVSIGTNHCMDGGAEGIRLTREILSTAGIEPVGAGLDETEARKAAVVRVRGRSFSFLTFCKKGNFTSAGNRPGAALLSEENLREDITRAAESSDHVVVLMHMGMEFSRSVHPMYRELAHLAVDLGASCVVGHHPHVIQGTEEYRGVPIFYSLGNFLFDNCAGAVTCRALWEERHQGLLAKITFQSGCTSSEAIPVMSSSEPLAVRLAEGIERNTILEEVVILSQAIQEGTDQGAAEEEAFSAIAKREIETIRVLTKIHGIRFIWYFLKDLKIRHFRMLFRAGWNRIRGR
jgi:poly-gamma-glutamate synthesis protein (capsule biosynthesis protein)